MEWFGLKHMAYVIGSGAWVGINAHIVSATSFCPDWLYPCLSLIFRNRGLVLIQIQLLGRPFNAEITSTKNEDDNTVRFDMQYAAVKSHVGREFMFVYEFGRSHTDVRSIFISLFSIFCWTPKLWPLYLVYLWYRQILIILRSWHFHDRSQWLTLTSCKLLLKHNLLWLLYWPDG